MADVNKINVNGTDYDIADATAREEISEINQSLTNLDFFNQDGTMISANSDLNDITDAGKYYVGSAANAATIENTPTVNNAYTLFVIKGVVPKYMEIAFANRGTTANIFYIRVQNSSNTWSDWAQIV